MMVQNINSCYEELVGVLLLIASKMAGMHPHQMEQLEGNVRCGQTRVELQAHNTTTSVYTTATRTTLEISLTASMMVTHTFI